MEEVMTIYMYAVEWASGVHLHARTCIHVHVHACTSITHVGIADQLPLAGQYVRWRELQVHLQGGQDQRRHLVL